MKTKILGAVAALFTFGPIAANADIIFENPWSGAINGNCQFECFVDILGAENFSLSENSTVEELAFEAWVRTSQNLSGLSIDWGIWTSAGPTPGTTQLGSGTSSPVLTNLGRINNTFDRYSFTLDILDLALVAGDYWASFDVNLPLDNFAIYWAETAIGDSLAAQSINGGVNWIPGYGGTGTAPYVFSITGSPTAVPEPGTLTLFGIGLLGLGLARRKTA